MFPYELAEKTKKKKNILSWSKEGDLIYDPFMEVEQLV